MMMAHRSPQESVLQAVANIRTGLWTNLSGGLLSALALLSKLPYISFTLGLISSLCALLIFPFI